MSKRVLTLEVLLSKEIEYLLEKEGYKEKQKLPSERELSEIFSAQRLTVRGALKILLQRGLIISKERVGYLLHLKG